MAKKKSVWKKIGIGIGIYLLLGVIFGLIMGFVQGSENNDRWEECTNSNGQKWPTYCGEKPSSFGGYLGGENVKPIATLFWPFLLFAVIT